MNAEQHNRRLIGQILCVLGAVVVGLGAGPHANFASALAAIGPFIVGAVVIEALKN